MACNNSAYEVDDIEAEIVPVTTIQGPKFDNNLDAIDNYLMDTNDIKTEITPDEITNEQTESYRENNNINESNLSVETFNNLESTNEHKSIETDIPVLVCILVIFK